jgi:hypothetical protein
MKKENAVKTADLVSCGNRLRWIGILRLRGRKDEDGIFYLILEFLIKNKIIHLNEYDGLYGILDPSLRSTVYFLEELKDDDEVPCIFLRKKDALAYIWALGRICGKSTCLGKYGVNGWEREIQELQNDDFGYVWKQEENMNRRIISSIPEEAFASQ